MVQKSAYIDTEAHASHLVDYIAVHIRLDLERYSPNIYDI